MLGIPFDGGAQVTKRVVIPVLLPKRLAPEGKNIALGSFAEPKDSIEALEHLQSILE
jgi:hypothetical protein